MSLSKEKLKFFLANAPEYEMYKVEMFKKEIREFITFLEVQARNIDGLENSYLTPQQINSIKTCKETLEEFGKSLQLAVDQKYFKDDSPLYRLHNKVRDASCTFATKLKNNTLQDNTPPRLSSIVFRLLRAPFIGFKLLDKKEEERQKFSAINKKAAEGFKSLGERYFKSDKKTINDEYHFMAGGSTIYQKLSFFKKSLTKEINPHIKEEQHSDSSTVSFSLGRESL